MKSFCTKYAALISLFLYSALSVLYFGIHVIFHLKARFVGTSADPTIYIWSFAWFAHVLTTHHGMFFSNVVFHPTGINLTKVTTIPALAILFAPITLLWGPLVSYNLCAIFSPGLAAFTAYLLCRYIAQSNAYGWIGGFFFGFSCYMIGQSLGHLNLVTPAIVIPLFVLFILYYLDKVISKNKFIVLFTISLVFLFLTEIEIFATAVAAGCIAFISAILFFKTYRLSLLKVIPSLLISFLLTIIIISPFLYHFFFGIKGSFLPDGAGAAGFSNSLLGFIVPVCMFFINSSFPPSSNIGEFNGYIGIGGLLLFIFYIKQTWRLIETRYLACMMLLFAVASLGPALHIIKKPVFYFPWQAIFTKTPLFKAALPCRLAMYMSLSFSVIVSLWLKKSTWKINHRFLMVFFAALFLFPNFHETHRPMVQGLYNPPFFKTNDYKKYISKEDNVVILPYRFGPALLWQALTNFHFNLAGGYLGLPIAAYANDPIFSALAEKTPGAVQSQDLLGFIKRHHVTKIIILNHPDYVQWRSTQPFDMTFDMGDYSAWEKIIAPLCYPAIRTGGVIVYRLK